MSKPMTKTQLVAALSEEMGTDKKSASAALDAICGLITREVSGGEQSLYQASEKSCAEHAQKEWYVILQQASNSKKQQTKLSK